jgi:hypothetical protein
MSRIRLSAALAGTVALVVGGATAASAHHCYIGTPTTHGPQSSNWFHITVEDAAAMFFGFEAECSAQSDAGYAALKDAGLPSSVKIFEKMTIGEGSQNPNGANGKGLEYFGAGSTVADDALATFVETAGATSCP